MFEWVHYQFPARLYFERDATHKIGSFVKDIGSRILILSIQDETVNADELAVIKTSLEKHTTGAILYDDIMARPAAEELDTAAYFAKQCRADAVLAFGSRETFQAARSVALLARNEVFASDINDSALPLKNPPLPVITVPVMPSMGEECSPLFSVHDTARHTTFFGHQDSRLFPSMIFVDPNVGAVLSANELARAGTAILTASVESILSRRSNEVTNSMALRAIELITRNLVTIVNDPNNHAARASVSMASILCGMAHANSLFGLSFSIATATNSLTGLDFYTAMSILLPHIMEYNLTTSAGKYVQIAKALDEDIKDITVIEAAIKAVEGVRKVFLELKVPQRLSEFEIQKADLPEIAERAFVIPFTKNTPRELDRNEIETILIAAY
ncbi:MAG: iron-containing alcohol dehydrogenase [Spirochaetales bacterium]|nr:iron-containing alcohol dehydrogenase [Leptospiraceae bacterium]MCP5483619.1 iron-containing alcohol dehydrogenase [Spirochaetales bacterium]MCP5484516.1 iron-containing alcohol dehydrogenase [Spirochaetales bacterium]